MKIRECIQDKLYEHLIIKKENEIKKTIETNLVKISEHIMCFYLYENFFLDYFVEGYICDLRITS